MKADDHAFGLKGKAQFDRAQAAWHRLAQLRGCPVPRDYSGVLERNGYLGGCADELCPATEEGRARIRELVRTAKCRGWCKVTHSNGYKDPPKGKWSMPEAFCPKCGKRPSYCECGRNG